MGIVDMIEPKNLFHSVMIDERVVGDHNISSLVNLIAILADNMYRKDFSDILLNPTKEDAKLHAKIDNVINPDVLTAETANVFYFNQGDVEDYGDRKSVV
jgi:hypothetical protein